MISTPKIWNGCDTGMGWRGSLLTFYEGLTTAHEERWLRASVFITYHHQWLANV